MLTSLEYNTSLLYTFCRHCIIFVYILQFFILVYSRSSRQHHQGESHKYWYVIYSNKHMAHVLQQLRMVSICQRPPSHYHRRRQRQPGESHHWVRHIVKNTRHVLYPGRGVRKEWRKRGVELYTEREQIMIHRYI